MRCLFADRGKINCTLIIEHLVTADMADGQPLPPWIVDHIVWCVVRRAAGRTLWRTRAPTSPPTARAPHGGK
jgi:hypothetical protein